jgi:import receptor subunit TOM20
MHSLAALLLFFLEPFAFHLIHTLYMLFFACFCPSRLSTVSKVSFVHFLCVLNTAECVLPVGYYDSFPSKSMNVAVKVVDQIETGADVPKKRKTVTITKDVAAGDVIYQEHPVVAVLDLDLEGKGTHCSHCLREIPAGSAVTPDHHPLSSVYCSKACQTKATAQYATLLFAKGPALPAELASADQSPEMQAGILMARHEAQAKFVEFLQTQCQERNVPHLLARFIARQVALETVKMMPGGATKLTEYAADLPPVDDAYGMDYSLWDHVERLRFLDVSVPDEEQEIMRMLLGTALPGLVSTSSSLSLLRVVTDNLPQDSFINDERHQVLKGKILYNSIGITPAPSGRDDRVRFFSV